MFECVCVRVCAGTGSLASHQRRAAPMLNKPEAKAPARLLTAEDCLSLMSDRITEVHGVR